MRLHHGFNHFFIRMHDTNQSRLSAEYSKQLIDHFEDILEPCLRQLLLAGHVPLITNQNVFFFYFHKGRDSRTDNMPILKVRVTL